MGVLQVYYLLLLSQNKFSKMLQKISKHQARKSILSSKTMQLLENWNQIYFCHKRNFITEPHQLNIHNPAKCLTVYQIFPNQTNKNNNPLRTFEATC